LRCALKSCDLRAHLQAFPDKAFFKMMPADNRRDFLACFSNNATNGKVLVPLDIVLSALDEIGAKSDTKRESLLNFVRKLNRQEQELIFRELATLLDARVYVEASAADAPAAIQLSVSASASPMSSSKQQSMSALTTTLADVPDELMALYQRQLAHLRQLQQVCSGSCDAT
jgi:hypothetical protein